VHLINCDRGSDRDMLVERIYDLSTKLKRRATSLPTMSESNMFSSLEDSTYFGLCQIAFPYPNHPSNLITLIMRVEKHKVINTRQIIPLMLSVTSIHSFLKPAKSAFRRVQSIDWTACNSRRLTHSNSEYEIALFSF
jgi:hypothetical protein